MNYPDLSIIIINWKSKLFVSQCLTSIVKNAGKLALEIIVVDNASYDGCKEMVMSQFPEVIFIQSDQNLGFAVANNLAFARSTGLRILFLNPDTEIHGVAIQNLLEGLESLPDAGMVGAHLLNSDHSVQTTCIAAVPAILNQTLNFETLRKVFPNWSIWGMQPLFKAPSNPVQVEAISGACMLGRREAIEHVGGFSTDYFMYAEDMDLCVKLTKANWKIYYVPQAKIIHHAGGSSSSRAESNFSNIVLRESLFLFLRNHRGTSYACLFRASTVLIAILRIFLLCVLSPILITQQGYIPIFTAVSKWWAILGWSVGIVKTPPQQSGIVVVQHENPKTLADSYMTDRV